MIDLTAKYAIFKSIEYNSIESASSKESCSYRWNQASTHIGRRHVRWGSAPHWDKDSTHIHLRLQKRNKTLIPAWCLYTKEWLWNMPWRATWNIKTGTWYLRANRKVVYRRQNLPAHNDQIRSNTLCVYLLSFLQHKLRGSVFLVVYIWKRSARTKLQCLLQPLVIWYYDDSNPSFLLLWFTMKKPDLSRLTWIFPGALLTFNRVPGNIQPNLTALWKPI